MDEGTGAESSVKTSSDGADTTSQTSQQSQELTFAWSEETYRLTDVCDADQLPRVVWLEGEDTASINLGLRGYLRQPVLLNHTASKTDCQARTVYRDKTNGKYFEVGQTLIIPDNYEGWFEIVPPSFGRAPYYSNIGEVTKVLPKRFFTRSAIDGVLISRDKDGKESFRERKIPPGAILRTETVFTARWKTQTQSGLFKKKEKQFVTQEIQYLRCRTSDRKEVMVPFQQTGKFHAIYESDRKEENLYSILRLKDLVKDFQLPLMVRLLYGKAPVVPCIFTGLLMLKGSEKRDTLIGSTVVNKRNVLFELPLDTPCNLKVSADEDQFDSVHSFKDAKRLCKKYAVPYTAMIKLSTELDTNQELVEHKPKGKRESQGESLQTLDLIKDMNIGETSKTESEEGDSASRAESESTEDGNVLELATEEDKKGETVC